MVLLYIAMILSSILCYFINFVFNRTAYLWCTEGDLFTFIVYSTKLFVACRGSVLKNVSVRGLAVFILARLFITENK